MILNTRLTNISCFYNIFFWSKMLSEKVQYLIMYIEIKKKLNTLICSLFRNKTVIKSFNGERNFGK